MSIEKCVVRLRDSHDTVHEATVYAESLYEAVLRGLNLLVDVGWEAVKRHSHSPARILEMVQEAESALSSMPSLVD
jgi:hypothetical protein